MAKLVKWEQEQTVVSSDVETKVQPSVTNALKHYKHVG